jgi:hypothetical protein
MRTYHRNITRVDSTVALRFYGGRLFAAARSREWSLLRRLAYAAAAPLIPLVRFRRIWPRATTVHAPRGLLPALLAGLAVDGTGEMVGYAFGGGDAVERSSTLEFHRERHVAKASHFGAATGRPGHSRRLV